MAIFILDEDYITRKNAQVADDIVSAQFGITTGEDEEEETTWYPATVQSVTVGADGEVRAAIVVGNAGGQTVSGIRLYDYYGNLIGEKEVEIEIETLQGVVYMLYLKLFQVKANAAGSGAWDAV